MVVPRPRAGCSASSSGPRPITRAGEQAAPVASPSAASRPLWAATPRGASGRRSSGRSAYVELYGAYAECEAIYGVDRLLARWDALDPDDQATFCFDPRVVDWASYTTEVHLPSVVQHARVRTTPGGRIGEKREVRLRRQVLAPERHLAAFDLENTLIASNVVGLLLLAGHPPPPPRATALRFVLQTLARPRRCSPLDRHDRSDFLRHFYRRYEGADVAQLEADAVEMFSDLILAQVVPGRASAGCASTARLGHRTVLITGALDLAIDAPAPAVRRHRRRRRWAIRPDGTYRGELTDVPPTGEARPARCPTTPLLHGFDLAESVAYADSTSDLPMLEAVGLPGGGEPRDPPGRARPQAGLARRALRQGRPAPRRSSSRSGPEWGRPRSRRVPKVPDVKALVFSREAGQRSRPR